MATVNPENSKIYNTEDVISQAGKRVYYNEEKDDYYVQGEFDYPVKKVKFHIDTERSQWPEPEPEPPMELEPGQVIRENGIYGADDPDGNGTIDFTKEENRNRSVTGTTNTLGTFVVNVPNGTETKSITSNGTYTPTAPNIGFSQVDVNVQPNLQSKTTTTLGSVTPDNGYNGLSSVTVNSNGNKLVYVETPIRSYSIGNNIYLSKTNNTILENGDTIPRNIETYIFTKQFGTITQNGTLDFRYTDPELNETCSLTTYDRYLTINVPNGTETRTLTSNGTYTPASPNIGFSQVTVDVSGPQISYFYNNRENMGSPYTWYYNDSNSSLIPTKTGSWQNKSVWIISGHDLSYKYEYTFTYYHNCSDDFIPELEPHDYWCIINNGSPYLYSNQVNYRPIVGFHLNSNLISTSTMGNPVFRGTIGKKTAELGLDTNYITNYSDLP